MKYRCTILVVFPLVSLLLMSGSAETANSIPETQQAIRYNVEYKCGGETIVISHCRKDSDLPGLMQIRHGQDRPPEEASLSPTLNRAG